MHQLEYTAVRYRDRESQPRHLTRFGLEPTPSQRLEALKSVSHLSGLERRQQSYLTRG